ncbi:MAG: DNA repair protein RadC [Verrucomicrobiota bacterium]|nr:DNA repair protein RadC [Verrucomicrobiota bacterium]MDG1890187.1 DNA repair protein RadC [Verrucomicrobiota bacterium]
MQPNLRIKDLPLNERPRERFLSQGAEVLGNTELIAILLRSGFKGCSAVGVATQLMLSFGSLHRLACADPEELQKVNGIGPEKAMTLKAAFTLASRVAREHQAEAPLLDTPDRVADVLREDACMREVEHFQVLLLNTRRKLIRVIEMTRGTLDAVLIHPREVFRAAVAHQASAIILAHNHPSGDPTPSEADIKVTRDLIRAGKIMHIEVLDHLILGKATRRETRDFVSLRELGYFYS